MDNHITIKTISGQINLPKSSAKIHIFHTPRSSGAGNAEVYLDKAATTPITQGVVKRVGFPSFSPSLPGTRMEVTGQRVEQAFSIAEGEIIKVFVNVRRGWGHLPHNGSVFLRVRKDAAYRKLRFKTLEHSDISFTYAEVEGTLDVLTLEDVKGLGVFVPKHLAMFAEQHNVQTILTENIVMIPEAAPAPRYEEKVLRDAATGIQKTFTVRRRRRAIE